MATEKKITVGKTVSASSVCSGTTYASKHSIIIEVTLHSIDEINAVANITAKCQLKSKYTRWAGDECKFSLSATYKDKDPETGKEVDKTELKNVLISSGGDENKSSLITDCVTWEKKNIPYNNDGNLTVKFTASVSGGSIDWAPGKGSVTMNVTFPYVARQSIISSIDGEYLGDPVTIVVEKKNDVFTHTLAYSFEGTDYTDEGLTWDETGLIASFTPTVENFAVKIPNKEIGVLTVKITTFNGDDQIGDAITSTIDLKLPEDITPFAFMKVTPLSKIVPPEWENVYIVGHSAATVKIVNAKSMYGATIASYTINSDSYSVKSDTLVTDVFYTASEITFTGSVTDTRGRTYDVEPVTIDVIEYQTPALTATAARCDSEGNLKSNGTYLSVKVEYFYDTVDKHNSITKSVTCNGVSTSDFKSVESFVFNANVSPSEKYLFTATIKDALGYSATKTIDIWPDSRVMNITKNKDGIAFGGFADSGNLTSFYPAVFHKGITGDLHGNTDTATALEVPRTIEVDLTSTTSATFDGSEDIAVGVSGVLPITSGGTGADNAAGALNNLGLTATAEELNYCDGVTSNIQTQLDNRSLLGANTDNGSLVVLWQGSAQSPTFAIDEPNAYKYYLVQVGTSDSSYATWIIVPYTSTYLSGYFRGIGGYESPENGVSIYSVRGTVANGTVVIAEAYARSSYSGWDGTGTKMYVKQVCGVK